MKLLKKLLKWIGYILMIPVVYVLISLILSFITVNNDTGSSEGDHFIYLSTNGIHLEIVIAIEEMEPELAEGIYHLPQEKYVAFGWGDENFYVNTPTWDDLTFGNAFSALFLNSSSLIHTTRHRETQQDWIRVQMNHSAFKHLNNYINETFQTFDTGKKIRLAGLEYGYNDDFYKAIGSYSCFKTCNSWVNSGLKSSGIKACLWTPFDFVLMNKYK